MTKDIVERLRGVAIKSSTDLMRGSLEIHGIYKAKKETDPDVVCNEAANEIERLRYKNEWLVRRLKESDNLFQVLLRDESLSEFYRPSVIEQLQDNMKVLDQ